ncbi:NFACT family protein, partial [bacterium]|nr:NFACT family protein [bacterium]
VSRDKCAIEISAEAGLAHIILRRGYHRKAKNSVDLFDEITNQKIKETLLDSHDRIIHITLMDESELMIELFGTVNVYHLDKISVVKNSFKDSKSYTGHVLEERPVKDIHQINISDFSDFSSHIRTPDEFSAKLSEGLGHLNKFLAMECLHSVSGRQKPYDALQNIILRLETEKPRIYWIHDEPKLFSLIHLAHYCEKHPEIREEIFDSVNDAVQIYIARKVAFRQKEKKLQELLRAIKIRIKKNQSLAASLAEERREAEGFELLERKAHLLNLHVPEIRRGMRDITVQNIYVEDQAPITIELNPELTPQKNIEYYFSLSKKMKSSVKKVGDRIQVLVDEIEKFEFLKKEFENGETRDWKKIEKIYDEFV